MKKMLIITGVFFNWKKFSSISILFISENLNYSGEKAAVLQIAYLKDTTAVVFTFDICVIVIIEGWIESSQRFINSGV